MQHSPYRPVPQSLHLGSDDGKAEPGVHVKRDFEEGARACRLRLGNSPKMRLRGTLLHMQLALPLSPNGRPIAKSGRVCLPHSFKVGQRIERRHRRYDAIG
jgi:hypothetical protein